MADITKADMSAALDAEGIINPDHKQTVLDAWLTLDADDRTRGLKLRRVGSLMSKEDLRANGIRTNSKLSYEMFNALADKGKSDPIHKIDNMVLIAMHASWRREGLEELTAARANMGGDLMATVYWHHRCDAAGKASDDLGDTFEINEVPRLPRPHCDYSICGCHLNLYPRQLTVSHSHRALNTAENERPTGLFSRLFSAFR